MKNRVWSLFVASLNTHYGWSSSKYYYFKKRQRIWEPILITASLIPVIILAIVYVWTMTEQLFLAGLAFGQPHLALINGTLIVPIIGIFLGFFYVLSAFYFSNDWAILIPLPLHSWEILSAKLGVILTGQYALNFILLVPILIKYALLAQSGLAYVITALVIFLVLPLIPLLISSILVVVLMRFVNLSQHKDKFTLIGGIIVIALVFASTFWLQGEPASMSQFLTQAEDLVAIIGKVFPPSLWAANALAYAGSGGGLNNLIYLLLSAALGLGVFYYLGEKVFLQGLLTGLEGRQKAGRRRRTILETKTNAPFWTLVSVERKLFMRDPGFALNGLIGYLLFPLMMFLPTLSKNKGANFLELVALGELPENMVMVVIAVFFMTMTAFSMIPATTFSREGKFLWIMQSLPLSIGQIVGARLLASQLINAVGCLIGLVPLVFMLHLSVSEVLLGIFFGLALASGLAHLLILFDLSRPMLDWIDPIKAVKSNLNAMIGVFGTMGFAALIGLLFYLNMQTATLWLIPIELLFLAIILNSLARILEKQLAPKFWAKI